MSTIATPRSTLADLMKTEGKAELIGGRIVQYMAGHRPSRVAARISRSLDDYAEEESATDSHSPTISDMPSRS